MHIKCTFRFPFEYAYIYSGNVSMEELCIFGPSERDLQGISLSTIQEKRFVIRNVLFSAKTG